MKKRLAAGRRDVRNIAKRLLALAPAAEDVRAWLQEPGY